MREYTQFYINGEWVDPAAPNSFDVINPATEAVCGHIALGNETDVDKAVAAAKAAFVSFGVSSREDRIALLGAILEAYKARYNDLADAISEEMGAPTKLAIHAQAATGAGHLAQALEVLQNFDFEEGLGAHRIFKEPIGVVGMITPGTGPLTRLPAKWPRLWPSVAPWC